MLLEGSEALLNHCGEEKFHAWTVRNLAVELINGLNPLLHLSSDAGSLLETSALLHDIGYCINKRGHHKHSAYIIQHSYLTQGWAETTRQNVALLVWSHRKPLSPKRKRKLNQSSTRSLLQLSALLRVADGLDRGHEGRCHIEAIAIEKSQIILTVTGLEDEPYHHIFKAKTDIWNDIIGRRLTINRRN